MASINKTPTRKRKTKSEIDAEFEKIRDLEADESENMASRIEEANYHRLN